MKLYATITSERASKGQGGNYYLHTNFNIGEKLYYEFIMEVAPNNEVRVQVNDYRQNKLVYSAVHEIEKGEKQWCKKCRLRKQEAEYCEYCGPKGKKQTGEWNEASDIHEGQHKNCSLCESWLDKTE